MRTQAAWVLAVGAIAAVIAVSAGGQAGPLAPSANDELRLQIGALERRVEALEERLSRQAPMAPLVIPPLAPGVQPLPKGWQQRQFNGLPYYLVPVQDAPHVAPPPAN